MSPQRTRSEHSPSGIRQYVMTPPTFFAVEYAINPWMDPSSPSTPTRSLEQWQALRATSAELGHTVDLVDPVAGLPDMVFAANGGLVLDGPAIVARFKYLRASGRLPRTGLARRRAWRPPRARQRRPGRCAPAAARSSWPATVFAPACGRTARSPGSFGRRESASTGRPALLPPRHRADGARRRDRRLLPARLPTPSRAAAATVPRRRRGGQADAYVFGLNASRTAATWSCPPPPTGFAAQIAEVSASNRSTSTCCRIVQGRRIRQMLHAGGTSVTILDTVTRSTDARDRRRPTATSHTTTVRCRWSSVLPKASGSRTSRAGATWTSCRPIRP